MSYHVAQTSPHNAQKQWAASTDEGTPCWTKQPNMADHFQTRQEALVEMYARINAGQHLRGWSLHVEEAT